MKKVIGLTGGIATGKSAATSILRDLGFTVIDADAVVHALQEPGGRLHQALQAEYGMGFFDENGRLDRKRLADLIFGDQSAYARLSDLQGQIIRQELEARREDELEHAERPFFMDIPLLFEAHYEALFDEIWLVTTTEEIQLKRLRLRSGLTEEEAHARITRQLSLNKKAELADVVLDNSATLSDLRDQILEQLRRL